MKQWKAPIVSLMVFVVLLTFVLWNPEQEENRENEQEREKMLDIQLKDIAKFTVNVGSEPVVFEPEDEDGWNWILSQDGEAASLHQLMVRTFVRSVAQLYPARIIEKDPENLAEFGLDSPWGNVVIELRDGSSHVLFVGDPSPITVGQEERRYALVDHGPAVILLDSSLVKVLHLDVNAFKSGGSATGNN